MLNKERYEQHIMPSKYMFKVSKFKKYSKHNVKSLQSSSIRSIYFKSEIISLSV